MSEHPENTASSLIRSLLGESEATRPGLADTPRRFTAAMQYLTSGYTTEPDSFMKVFEDGAEHYDGLVFQGKIAVYSLCEHHLLPFFGIAHVGYIPSSYQRRVIGLSKIARIVDMFSRRVQVQERLTRQISGFLESSLDARAVGVVLRCRHMCMEMRGVQKSGTITYTSSMRGDFMDDASARSEFMTFVEMADRDLVV